MSQWDNYPGERQADPAGKFWMIYGQGQGCPTVQHRTRRSAIEEAKRLARVVPGVRFWVLEVIGSAERIDVQYRNIPRDPGPHDLDDDIPF